MTTKKRQSAIATDCQTLIYNSPQKLLYVKEQTILINYISFNSFCQYTIQNN